MRRTRGCVPMSWNTLSIRFSVNSSNRSCDGSPRTVQIVHSLLVDAGCNVRTTASCGTDIGDVGVAELEEPVNKPGTTIGT